MKTFVLVPALVVLLGPAAGLVLAEPPPPQPSVDDLVGRFIRPDGPGAAVLVLRDGRTLLARGYGLADVEKRVPVTPDSVFGLASLSKAFTAMAVMILHDRGRLDFDDDVRKHLPRLPEWDRQRPIRLADLLHHTSGLPDYFDLVFVQARNPHSATNADVLDVLTREPRLRFATGSRHQYCNSNYALLALVVEQVSGQKFSAFLHDEIFQPLGMRHTLVFDDPELAVKDQARGYRRRRPGAAEVDPALNLIVGDNNVLSTVRDLAAWDDALHNGRLVKPETLRLAFTPGRLDSGRAHPYGFGWVIERREGRPYIWHNGSWAGYRTFLGRWPEDKLTVVVLSNNDGLSPDRLGEQIAALYLGQGG
jgi:CubicO group peptidase (beta-lactamase class C family)